MEEDKNYYLFVNNQYIAVSKAVYDTYRQGIRKEKYIAESDEKHRVILIDFSAFEEQEGNDEIPYIESKMVTTEERIMSQELFEELHKCIDSLPRDERELINALFFDEETEKSYAEKCGLTQSGVSRKRAKILEKLRNILSKIGGFSEFLIFLI